MTIEITHWVQAPRFTDRHIFAIGDVHGCADQFSALLTAISGILNEKPITGLPPVIIQLGDLIDRGPASIRCLDIVIAGIELGGETGCDIDNYEQHYLRGNHEQFVLSSIFGPRHETEQCLTDWIVNGGLAVTKELGIDLSEFANEHLLAGKVRAAFGDERLNLLRSMKSHVRFGDYLFVHAGIRPDQPLDVTFGDGCLDMPYGSSEEAWSPLWIREPFLEHVGAFPENVCIVHGHTISGSPAIFDNRIGIDTGAFSGGPLTAVELKGNQMRFIQAFEKQEMKTS